MKPLRRRIIDIAYRNQLNHIGSFLNAVDTVDSIYCEMAPSDIFILSNGHASLAQYVVLEKRLGIDAESAYLSCGGHPHLGPNIHCSTGSLGMGITVAVGYAMADHARTVHCMLSDGECAEGSVWESLRYAADAPLLNLKLYVICNGWSALGTVDVMKLWERLEAFNPHGNIRALNYCPQTFVLKGLDAHYKSLTEEQYKQAICD